MYLVIFIELSRNITSAVIMKNLNIGTHTHTHPTSQPARQTDRRYTLNV